MNNAPQMIKKILSFMVALSALFFSTAILASTTDFSDLSFKLGKELNKAGAERQRQAEEKQRQAEERKRLQEKNKSLLQQFKENKKEVNEQLIKTVTSHQSSSTDPERDKVCKEWLERIAVFAKCSQENPVSGCQKFLKKVKETQQLEKTETTDITQEQTLTTETVPVSRKKDSSSVNKEDFEKSLGARMGYLSRIIGPSAELVKWHDRAETLPLEWVRKKMHEEVKKGVSKEYDNYQVTDDVYFALVCLSKDLARFDELKKRDGKRVERIFNDTKVSTEDFEGTLDFVEKVEKEVQRRAPQDISETQRFLLENLVMIEKSKEDPNSIGMQEKCNPEFRSFEKTKKVENVCDDCLKDVRRLALGRFAAYKTRKEWHPDFKKQAQEVAQSSG